MLEYEKGGGSSWDTDKWGDNCNHTVPGFKPFKKFYYVFSCKYIHAEGLCHFYSVFVYCHDHFAMKPCYDLFQSVDSAAPSVCELMGLNQVSIYLWDSFREISLMNTSTVTSVSVP